MVSLVLVMLSLVEYGCCSRSVKEKVLYDLLLAMPLLGVSRQLIALSRPGARCAVWVVLGTWILVVRGLWIDVLAN